MNPQIPQQADPLAQLRDIHLPNELASGPLPLIWYLLITAIILLILILAYYRFYFKPKNLYKTQALSEIVSLSETLSNYDNLDIDKAVSKVSRTLRRVALTLDSRESVASLQGDPWLTYLDSQFPKNYKGEKFLNSDIGQLIKEERFKAPSKQTRKAELENLCQTSIVWINKAKPQKAREAKHHA